MSTHDPQPASSATPERWTVATVYDDMWVDPDDDAREATPHADAAAPDDEAALLRDYLRYYRLTLEMKCAGLDAEQLATRSVPPSTMSLLGLLRHITEDERHVRRVMAAEDAPKLYCSAEDRHGDWDGAVGDAGVVEEAWRRWREEQEATDRWLASVEDLSTRNAGVSDFGPDGADLTVRDVLVAHVVEYARHCGHADLLRERVDGRVGQ